MYWWVLENWVNIDLLSCGCTKRNVIALLLHAKKHLSTRLSHKFARSLFSSFRWQLKIEIRVKNKPQKGSSWFHKSDITHMSTQKHTLAALSIQRTHVVYQGFISKACML